MLRGSAKCFNRRDPNAAPSLAWRGGEGRVAAERCSPSGMAAKAAWLLALLVAPAWADSGTAGDVLRVALPLTAASKAWLSEDQPGLVMLGKTMLTEWAAVLTLKATVNAERPNGEAHSFPSGHTADAFAAATFLQQRYGARWGVPAYALAAYTGWSRVDAKQHYWRDVLAGAAIGSAAGYYWTDSRVTVVPAGPGDVGVTVAWRW